jgi:hypothetical protein
LVSVIDRDGGLLNAAEGICGCYTEQPLEEDQQDRLAECGGPFLQKMAGAFGSWFSPKLLNRILGIRHLPSPIRLGVMPPATHTKKPSRLGEKPRKIR